MKVHLLDPVPLQSPLQNYSRLPCKWVLHWCDIQWRFLMSDPCLSHNILTDEDKMLVLTSPDTRSDEATHLVLDDEINDVHQQPTSSDIQILTEGFLLPLHLPFAWGLSLDFISYQELPLHQLGAGLWSLS